MTMKDSHRSLPPYDYAPGRGYRNGSGRQRLDVSIMITWDYGHVFHHFLNRLKELGDILPFLHTDPGHRLLDVPKEDEPGRLRYLNNVSECTQNSLGLGRDEYSLGCQANLPTDVEIRHYYRAFLPLLEENSGIWRDGLDVGGRHTRKVRPTTEKSVDSCLRRKL